MPPYEPPDGPENRDEQMYDLLEVIRTILEGQDQEG